MRVRNLMLTMLGGGTLAGLLLGSSVETTMKPSPAPPWRHAVQVDPTASSYQYVDSGPQDLSPYWPVPDRTPTWARRRMADQVAYVPPTVTDDDAWLHEPEADEPADAAEVPTLTLPMLDTAAAQDAADDARDAMTPAPAPPAATVAPPPADAGATAALQPGPVSASSSRG